MSYYCNRFRIFDVYDLNFLCEIKLSDNVKNILGVSKCGENKIIITYPHSVQLIEVSEVEPHYVVTREWNTRLKLSSAVVHDANTDTFVGVFHDLFIRIWTIHEDSFDDAEKFTFQNQILKLLPREDNTSLVIFKNGYCISLLHALENSKLIKVRSLIRDSSSIVESSYYTRNKTDYVCYIVRDKSKQYSVLTCPVRDELADCDRVESEKVLRGKTEGATVSGHQIIACGSKKQPFVYFTWSDSKISQFDLQKRSWKVYRSISLSPMIKNETTAITPLGKNYVMFYGSHYNDTETLSAPHIMKPNWRVTQVHLKDRHKSYRVFCPMEGFAVTVNDINMSLWRTCLIKVNKQLEPSFDVVLSKSCMYGTPLLPVCGWNENKVWRRSQPNTNFIRKCYP